MTISTKDYLRGIAGSRALYIALFEHVRGLLPPADLALLEPVPLVVSWTLADVAKGLGASVSTVRTDLMRLENYGWLEWNRRPYFLGQRAGLDYHLVADGQAHAKTGEPRLVSREVLKLEQTSNTPTPPVASVRGMNRNAAWEGKP